MNQENPQLTVASAGPQRESQSSGKEGKKERLTPSTLENVIDALGPEYGQTFVFDKSRHRIAAMSEGSFRLLDDVDFIGLRLDLERKGYAPVSRNRLHEALRFVAQRNAVPNPIA